MIGGIDRVLSKSFDDGIAGRWRIATNGRARVDGAGTMISALPRSAESDDDERVRKAAAAESADVDLFRQQEPTLIVLNLIVLAVLALFHSGFGNLIGSPTLTLLGMIVGRFLTQLAELAWLQNTRRRPSARAVSLYARVSIWLNVVFAGLATLVVSHEDSHYSVLFVIPIVSAAFRLSLAGTLSVVTVSIALTFFQVWNYFRLYPPAEVTEFFEATTTSLIFLVVGLIAWVLGNSLRNDRSRLAESLAALNRARDRLVQQEKLAAIGRLSSALAHEIRNPVAMISSSLGLASDASVDSPIRDEMFQIAATESARLERLTTDFLSYARTRPPERRTVPIVDVVEYVASLARVRAAVRSVNVESADSSAFSASFDVFQIQQALLNLALNAIEASPAGGTVRLGAERRDDGSACIHVEDDGPAIDAAALDRLFEPLFTTKASGTGLGLSIARSIARAHGGDVELAFNEPGRVRFELVLPVEPENRESER